VLADTRVVASPGATTVAHPRGAREGAPRSPALPGGDA
jgi:hypothetical protein